MKLKHAVVYCSFFLASLIVLGLHASLILNTRFIADDYCSAYLGQRLGVLRYIWFWYLNWGGRYAAIGADMALAWVNPQQLGLVTLSILMVWAGSLAAIFYAVFVFFRSMERLLISFSLSFVTLYILITLLPNIPQSLYWYSAFRTHFLPVIVLCVHLAIYLFYRRARLQGLRHYLFVGAFGFCFSLFNAGFSEAFTLTQLSFWALVFLFEFFSQKEKQFRNFSFSLLCVAGSMIGILIMLSAPGNANRQDTYRQPESIFEIVSISVNGYGYFWSQILTSPERILALIGFFSLVIFVAVAYPKIAKISFSQIAVISFAGVGLSFVSFVPSAYGIAKILPDRGFPIPTFFLIFGLSIALFLLGNFLAGSFSKVKFLLASIGITCFFFSMFFSASTLIESRSIYTDYARTLDKIEMQISVHKAAGLDSIHIPKLNNWAGAFDPNENPKFWVTYCASKYYDIQVIGPAGEE